MLARQLPLLSTVTYILRHKYARALDAFALTLRVIETLEGLRETTDSTDSVKCIEINGKSR